MIFPYFSIFTSAVRAGHPVLRVAGKEAEPLTMKIMNTAAYVSTLRELTEQGHEVSLVVSGHSMTPFLADGRDTIYFRKPDSPLAVGDMVFFQRTNGLFVMHRICRIRDGRLFLVGDAQTDIEGPVSPSQVFARVTRVRRKGKLIGPGNFWWEFFRRIWIHMVPFRHGIMRLYRMLHF